MFGGRRAPFPFASAGVETEADDFVRMSGLDPETERLTPDGKFMYQNRDSGEWMSMDQPLIRTERRNYGSFAKRQTDEIYQEIRDMMEKADEKHRSRTAADRMRDRFADGGNLPSQDVRILCAMLLLLLGAIYLAFKRTFSYPTHQRSKRSWYGELRDNKLSFDELYDEIKPDLDLSVVAATLVFLAATRKKSLDDPIVKPVPEAFYNATVPPRSHFAITPGV